MAILPISYLVIQFGASPTIAYVVLVCVYPMAFFMDLYIINKYTQFPIFNYLSKSILPSLAFIIITYLIANSLVGLFSPAFMRVVFTTIVSSAIYIPIVYYLGLTPGERVFVNGAVMKKLKLKKANRFTE